MKVVEAMIAITQVAKAAHYLVLGAEGVEAVDKKMAAAKAETSTWRRHGL